MEVKPMAKILIVDDEDNIRSLIKKYALYEGHNIKEAKNGIEASEMAISETFDLIIMDIMMPELDGFSAVKTIRKTKDTPVIMLSARGEEYDKIHGFELGIDDYMVKPFSPRELMMRIDAILKRAQRGTLDMSHEIYDTKNLFVDFTARKVKVSGVDAPLSPKEFDLLFYLIRNKNIALSREKLITEVWGYAYDGDDRTLDTHIKLLRKSLGDSAGLITTLRGVGYRFEGDL
jgi:DNA-binding response OmpR family regulator